MKERHGLVRTLPFAFFIVLLALEPLLQDILPPHWDARWLYGVRTVLTALILFVLWGHYSEMKAPSRVSPKDWGLGLVVGVLVFAAWVNLDVPPLALDPGAGFDPRTTEGGLHPGLVAARLVGAVLVVPVMEELFWRSFIMRWMQSSSFLQVPPATVGLRALVLSSALFATEHRLWFAGLLAGLAYGWLYKRTGNLRVPILAHAVTNALLGLYVLATGSWTLW
jgi:CAAX prenyl protease-like protein